VFFHGSKRTTVSSENESGTLAMVRRLSSTDEFRWLQCASIDAKRKRGRAFAVEDQWRVGVPRAGLRASLSVERTVTCAGRMSTSSATVEIRNAGGV
jgi:hypothetical protein